jgi:hypothetical protein
MRFAHAALFSRDRKAALRIMLLRLIATVSSLAALTALLDPERVAGSMGLFLVGVNGYSQFYALYVGVRLATALLALFAARHGEQPVLGDVTALFVLAQPFGRLVAAVAIGLPQDLLLLVSCVELLTGLLLLLTRERPGPRPAQ